MNEDENMMKILESETYNVYFGHDDDDVIDWVKIYVPLEKINNIPH